MAAAAVMHTFLEGKINVSTTTAQSITDQGLDDFDEIVNLSEEDMKTMCNNVRSLEGNIMNPHTAVVGHPPTIRNPGSVISIVAEKRLALIVYTIIHQSRISCHVDAVTMTQPYITGICFATYSRREVYPSTTN